MKTPEEIKKGLEYLSITDVAQKVEAAKRGLPYAYVEDIASDALAYIQQIERERDAAVEQLKAVDVSSYFECAHCKHEELCDSPVWPCNDCDNEECPCHTCSDGSNWQWRGVQEVE